MTPQEPPYEITREDIMASMQPPPQQPPKGVRKAGMVALRVLGGVAGLALGLLRGAGMLAMGGMQRLMVRRMKTRATGAEGKETMGLRHVFWATALLGGALMGPGLYYMPQAPEIVRTRVTGKVQADLKAEFPGRKYFIFSKEGKFDTYAIPNGKEIREGCVYDFNVKSARFQLWPPGYSRSITSFTPAPGGGCEP